MEEQVAMKTSRKTHLHIDRSSTFAQTSKFSVKLFSSETESTK